MHRYLVVTIDVEPDCSPSWRYSDPLTFIGVTEGIRHKLQPLFNKYGITPTYLINNVVLEDNASIDIFKSLEGKFEIGTHLHSEFMDPQKLYHEYAGMKGEANQCDLAPDIEFEKMKNITELFEKKFNRRPFSFRAGRFSAGKNTISCLEKLGYKVETSVTPHIVWKDRTRPHVIDYSRTPDQPYFVSPISFPYEDKSSTILEVPVTIIPKSYFFRKKYKWLRPYYSNYESFVKITEMIAHKHSGEDVIVYNMMFHNVEVIPALSPYCHTKEDCDKYMNSLENYFIFCSRKNIFSVSLSELAEIWKR